MTRMMFPLALMIAVTGCSGVAVEEGGEGGDGGEATTTTTTTASSGTGGSGGSTSSSSSGSGGTGGGICETPPPIYSDNCAEVPTFQCGIMPSCDGTTITMSWHEHVMCGGDVDDIVDYSCSYVCPGGCIDDYSDWPEDGQTFVETACLPAAS